MGTSFMGYVWQLWGSPLPMQLMRAILVAALFEVLLYLVQVRLRRLLAPVMGRDVEADAVLRLERWRVVVGLPMLLTRVVFYAVALAIILRIFRFRADQDLYPVLLGALALVLVAGRDTLRDMVAGYFIRYDHLFGLGDEITVGEHSGMVSELSLRATRLRTRDGQEVVIRNALVRTLVHRTGPGRRAAAVTPPPGA
jgi:small conductance mechanosensitive channel